MTLDQCRKIAIRNHRPGKDPMFFDLIGKEKTMRCFWIDAENGIFGIWGMPGFIDSRDMQGYMKTFKRCEIVKQEKGEA